MFKLVRHFTIMSAIAVLAITVTLAFLFSAHQMRLLRAHTEERNLAMARLVAAAAWSRHGAYIANSTAAKAEEIRARPETTTIDREMRQFTKGLSVAKVKIYSPSGLTLYSSDFSQIGEDKSKEPEFAAMLRNGRISNKIQFRKEISSFDDVLKDRYVAESYVPILVDGKLSGVLEVYGDITEDMARIRREMVWAALLCIVSFGVLYGLLFMIVRRADRIIMRQYRQLEAFNDTLEAAVADRTRRLINQHSVLAWITRSSTFRQGTQDDVCKTLTKSIASSIGVERASIWLYNEERTAIRCVDLYESVLGRHSSGSELRVSDYPSYFAALEREEIIAADHALTDPRTNVFAESYLKKLGIGAMLDAPIVQDGSVIGVVCCERLGEAHAWSAEERLLAAAISNLMSLTLERLERSATEESLKEAHANLQVATRAKSLFLANMSHEIRTPMNGVFGMTDLLLRTELTERQQRLTHTIQRSAKSLLTIINDVLDISRIEAGKLSLDANDFDVRHAIEETVDLLAEEADRKGIGLSLYIAPTVPGLTVGDAGRVRQVATNLISNAIKFTKSGEVAVRVETANAQQGGPNGHSTVVLTVRDTGVGIPKDVQDRLFQPFHQADTSITRRFGGTGLGLSISRHLVEMMGGKINLVSAEGVGTIVSVELPLRISAESEHASLREQQPNCLKGKRILVLDDRATNREIVLAYLKDAGALASGLGSADDAFTMLRAAAREGEPFDAAIVDMVMPSVTGLEVGRRIKSDPAIKATRLIMLTSLSWKGDVGAVRREGFEALLVKPVRGVELVRTVVRALQSGGVSGVAQQPAHAAVEARTSKLKARVLLAEDNAVNLEVAKEFLGNLGCSVVVAENGLEALNQFTSHSFDLVLMDCQMPEMDGLTATRRIRAHEESKRLGHTPIIAVTANAFEEDRQACLAAGMDDYIRKPFVEEVLEETMSRWLKKKGRPTESPTSTLASTPAVGMAIVSGTAAASEADGEVPPAAAASETRELSQMGPALDPQLISRLMGAHRALLSRLIETYLNYAPNAVSQVMAQFEAGSLEGLKTAAHSLKSSSANVGASSLSALCRDLEALARADGASVDERCKSIVTAIEAEFKRVEAALGELRIQLAQDGAKGALRG